MSTIMSQNYRRHAAINYMSTIMSQNGRKIVHNAAKKYDWVYRLKKLVVSSLTVRCDITL